MRFRCFLCSSEYVGDSMGTTPCPCCHVQHNIPAEEVELFRGLFEASKYMRARNFNKARKLYVSLCREYPSSFYPYFGLAASKYGVICIDNSPVCLSACDTSFLDDTAFRKAVALLEAVKSPEAMSKREKLIRYANRIEENRRETVKKAALIPGYDIFIAINYDPGTKEYDKTADRLYERFAAQGSRVFFAPVEIPDADDIEAEPHVYRALSSAGQMVVYVSSADDAKELRLINALGRYHALVSAGLKDENSIVVAYSDMSADELPAILKRYPSFFIKGSEKAEEPAEETLAVVVDADTEIADEQAESLPEEQEIAPESTLDEDKVDEKEPQKSSDGFFFGAFRIGLARAMKSIFNLGARSEKEQPEAEKNEEKAPTEEPVEEIVEAEVTAESSPTEEPAAEEASAEETPAEKTVEETIAEEPVTEEAPAEEETAEEPITEDAHTEEVLVLDLQSDEVAEAAPAESDEQTEDDAEQTSSGETDERTEAPEEICEAEPESAEEDKLPEVKEEKKEAEKPKKEKIKKEKPKKEKPAKGSNEAVKGSKAVTAVCIILLVGLFAGIITALYAKGWIFSGTFGLEFKQAEGGYYVYDYTGRSEKVRIPAVYRGKKVLGIKSGAFRGNNVTTLVIADSVRDFEAGCFSGMSRLQSIKMHATYSEHESASQRGEADVLKGLFGSLFGDKAFSNSIKINQTVGSAEYSAYIPVDLKEIEITGGRLEIGAFSDFKTLEKITLSDKVTVIEPYAFFECERLEYADVGNGTICFGDYSFFGCISLNEIKGGENVYIIGKAAFSGCSRLPEFTFSENTVELGDFAFNGCSSLGEINLPAMLQSIGNYTFMGCTSIVEVRIPSRVKGTFDGVFRDCTSLRLCNGGDGLSGYGDSFFAGCTSLESVIYPLGEKFVEIGDSAFYGCTSLTSVCSSQRLQIIGKNAYAMSGIEGKVVLPDSVVSIGENAFAFCEKLEGMTIPKGCEVGNALFAGCTRLRTVTLELRKIPSNFFNSCSSLTTVNGLGAAKEIGSEAFSGCTSLTEVDLSSCEVIGEKAFASCGRMTSVKLAEGLKTINAYAFAGCTSVTRFDIPSTVIMVGAGCFSGCVEGQTIDASKAKYNKWDLLWSGNCKAEIVYGS